MGICEDCLHVAVGALSIHGHLQLAPDPDMVAWRWHNAALETYIAHVIVSLTDTICRCLLLHRTSPAAAAAAAAVTAPAAIFVKQCRQQQ
jgi:hypothetical protein